MMDYIITNEPVQDEANGVSSLPNPTKLTWKVTDDIKNLLLKQENTAKLLIADTESCLLQTDVYGSRFIKEVAKASPDAYMQVALQITWKRLHSEPTAVYETATTRHFLHGRTETCRSLTTETWKLADNFDNDHILASFFLKNSKNVKMFTVKLV